MSSGQTCDKEDIPHNIVVESTIEKISFLTGNKKQTETWCSGLLVDHIIEPQFYFVFSQSVRNFSMPMSVSGCFAS